MKFNWLRHSDSRFRLALPLTALSASEQLSFNRALHGRGGKPLVTWHAVGGEAGEVHSMRER